MRKLRAPGGIKNRLRRLAGWVLSPERLAYASFVRFGEDPDSGCGRERFGKDDSLLVLVARQRLSPLLQDVAQVLVDGEGDGLAGRHTRHTRRDTGPEGARALLLEHVAADADDAAHGGLAGLAGRAAGGS